MKKKILVTGANGLVGYAIREESKKYLDKYDFIFATREDADLTDRAACENLFKSSGAEICIGLAAKVGGLGGHLIGSADYFYQNLLMGANVINSARIFGVKKLLIFSSVCVFPENLEILQEDKMHDGPPFALNAPYAHSKRVQDIFIQALKKQHGVENYCSIIPSNIIGCGDLYDLSHGHVLPCLIHKMYLAKRDNTPFKVWGTGRARREFLLSSDIADILMRLVDMEKPIPDRLVIAGDIQYSISDIVQFLVEAADFKGEVVYESDKPDGQMNRRSDISRLMNLFPDFKHTPVKEAVRISYQWFSDRYPNVRLIAPESKL